MDATQMISDSILESDEEENVEEERRRPLAKLCILKNEHIPEKELPLYLGDNVLGRDPNTCTLLMLAPSISKQHATICISVYRRRSCHSEVDIEALVWDLGSMNGTRKGRLKLTPNVRYALGERDSLVVADIPCRYVTIDAVASRGDTKTPVGKELEVNARLPGASGEKGSDTSTGSKKCVNGVTKARVSLPDQEDTRKTPIRSSCLSFEQTPTQPQGTLVPESDSDSDEERGDRRRKALVSDADSHKSSPTCSTFLSPTNKIVPESEDESPITPSSSSTKNRPYRHVNFSKEEIDVGRQQLKKKKAVDDSEEEEERAALGGRTCGESGQHVLVKQQSNVSLTGEGGLPASTPAVITDAIPAFDMDSDTDVEGEDEGTASVALVTLNTNQQADQPPNTDQFHMDSDTEVEDDDDSLDIVHKSVPSSTDHTKPPVISVVQPEGITMDSDTDVEDAAVSDAATKSNPLQSTHTADCTPSTQLKDFHLDSDTDGDEGEEEERGTNDKCAKVDETPTRLDIKPSEPESAPAAPHSLHLDSDTDDEAIPAPPISEPSVMSAVTESVAAVDARPDLGVLSDSDTDVEEGSPLVIPGAISNLSVEPDTTSDALQSDSDAGTDVDESIMPPAGDRVIPAEHKVDSDTDVEDKEVDFEEAGEGHVPSLHRENTPGLLAPLQQNCSTPVQASEGRLEDMETQAFLSPSSALLHRAVAPAARPRALSSCSDSQEDDFTVAETQSFVLQTRDCQGTPPEDHTMDPTQAFGLQSSGDEKGEQSCRGGSFQLGLSDSSHLQGQAQALAMESTQAFAPEVGGVNLEDTQAYAAISNADRTSLESDSNPEYEEPVRCSVMAAKEGQVDLDLEATQMYISEPYSDSEDETDEDERKSTATAETQPFNFPVAETQAVSAFEEEESLDKEVPTSSVLQVKPSPQNRAESSEEHGEAAQPQKRHLREALSAAETQPMNISEDEESDDEDLTPGPRERKAESLQHELALFETQPMHTGVAETQPVDTGEDGESDEEDSIPGPQKQRAKPRQLEEETQSLTSSEVSAVETQPTDSREGEQSDEEDSSPGPRKRKAKALRLDEEETQPLTSSEVSAVETQPMAVGEDGESDEEDTIPGPRKRKAKPLQIQEENTQPLTNSEASTAETDLQPQRGSQPEAGTSGAAVRGRRRTRAREEEKQAECSEPPKRQTSGRIKAVPTTRRRRGKLRPDEEQSEEEEQAKPARGKKSTRQQKDEEKEERSKQPGANNLMKKQEEENKLERERKEKEEKERVQAENAERLEQERVEQERIERKRKEEEEKMRAERAQKEKDQLERERKEKEEKERIERETAEREERKRLENGRKEKERLENERKEKERLENERKEKELLENERKEKERLENERKEKERLENERKENERLENERKEKERLENERKEKERLENERKEKERLENERKEKERLENERKEKERLENERKEKERLENERKEKERLETVKRELEERLERERKEQEDQAKLEREEEERLEKEKQEKEVREIQINEQQENKPKAAARGRRAARKTVTAPCKTEPEQASVSTNDDVPARRTRSHSNSSNSVSSERSTSSMNTEGSSGKCRGRVAKRTSGPPEAATARGSNRRRTAAAEPAQQDSNDVPPQGCLSRSNSTNSLNSEISSCSVSSQSRGRGGRQRGRGRKTEAELPINSQGDQNMDSKPTARGRKGRETEASSSEVKHEGDKEKAGATRGRWRADANVSEPAAADEKDPSSQECASEESPQPKRNVRGRGQKVVKSETVEAPVAPAVSDGDENKERAKGRKRELEAGTGEDPSSSSKISKGREKETEAAEEEAKNEIQVQAKRRGRASAAQAKKSAKDPPTELEVKGEGGKNEGETVGRRGRGRPSVAQEKKKEEPEESGASVDQDSHVESQAPSSSASRKRQAPVDVSPAAKTPRSCSASPAASGRFRAASQNYKVLFTGVMDEEGERVLARLGGSMANGVADMNCLVTDKVRRTVKFLCAVAKGIPVVTTHWLEKSGKAGSFLSPNAFVVKDLEQEKKFNFCLQDSLRIASSQPLLQGFEIHVTKSAKPEPVQMKDIISCSGATFLPRMPSSHKPQTIVISCEEDWSLCGPALSASIPVVTAEFILTGILQQKLDLQSYALSAPANTVQPAGGKGRSRKRT